MSADKVYEALLGLQHDAARRREFNEWLQQFQRSPEAWAVAGEVLHRDDAPRELKIFCAQTVRNKAAYDLHQVPAEARVPLKAQIIELLERNRALLRVVGVQLCLALAALAMQMVEWDDPVQELIARLDRPDMVPLLFEFLKVLPEEFHSKRSGLVNPAVVLDRSTQLIQNKAYAVMEFILNRADIMARTSDTKALFFAALNPWLQEVQLDDILASPLVPWMLASFGDEEARAPATDCLVLVLQEAGDVYEPAVQRAVHKLCPELLALAQTHLGGLADDAELHRDVTRLLAEAALAWHVLIARDPAHFYPLLDAVAQCVLVPETELTTLELPFKFFERLNLMVGEPLPSMDTPSSVHNRPAEDLRLRSSTPVAAESRAPFQALFLRLLACFVRHLELPDRFESPDAEEIFRDFRYEIGDMLKVCSGIAGHEAVLQWFHTAVAAQTAGAGSPRAAEALLFAIRSIARTVPPQEDHWMPRLFDAVFQLPFLAVERVQHAAIMLLGRYSQWATFHPDYLRASLDQIIHSSWSPFPEVRRASAHAFLYFSSDASLELAECLPQILDFYTQLASHAGDCELEAFLNYSDGVGFVLNNLAEQAMAHAVEVVVGPVTAQAEALLAAYAKTQAGAQNSAPNSAQSSGEAQDSASTQESPSTPELDAAAAKLGNTLQGLGSVVGQIGIFKSENEINTQHPLYVAVMANNALFTQILRDLGPHHTGLAESVAKYYIKVLFNLTGSFQPDLPLLLTAVYQVLSTQPLLPVLYELSSTISQCYSAYVEPNPVVDQAIWLFLNQTCSVLFTPEVSKLIEKDGESESEDSPIIQLVFQGFHLLCDVAVYFPGQFLDTLFDPAVVLSAHVLRFCYDQDCLASVGHFYDDVKSLMPHGGHPDPHVPANAGELIKRGMGRSGSHLLRALFYWFMVKPDSYFEPRAEAMVDFVFSLVPEPALGWLNTMLAELPAGTTNEQEVTQFLGQVFQDTTNPMARGVGMDMNRFIQAYAARNYDPRI